MAGEYIFSLQRVTKQYNRVAVLNDISLSFFFGAKIGVIGGNGSGKSTLLRILGGIDRDVLGSAYLAPNVRVGYLPQEPQLDPTKTVTEIVDEGVASSRAVLKRYDEVCDLLAAKLPPDETAKLNDELGIIQDKIDNNNLWELDHAVELAMDALRLPPGDMSVATLSGGEKRRVALCRLLISNPDALLLDEPTNHLDAESVGWMELYLKKFKGTVVVVTHDRYFLHNVTAWILELEGGHAFPFKGNYGDWLVQKQALLEREAKQASSRNKLLEQELKWVRLNPSARQAKGKARLNRYEELVNQTVDTREDNLQIRIPPGPRLGNLVVSAKNLTKSFGERLLFEDVNFDLPPGGIVGVIGGNGAGKTTLFRMILKQDEATSGQLTV
ncbi:MAG: ATP-binding cassette domain-containing protein, partial [bacterium]